MPQVGIVNPFVPDAYVQVVAPPAIVGRGVLTNLIGVVGTAPWGPVNSPAPFSSLNDCAAIFGAMKNRKYDLGSAVAAAVAQGASNFRGVRVTDGTDTAASIAVLTNCITFTSKYTGTGANADTVTIAAGSAASSFKATVQRPGYAPEVFDNITGSGNALWVAMATAINSGQSGLRGPSNLIVATAGAGVTAPTLATYTLTGGTDGATTITGAVLVGADTGSRTGMYALRGIGPAIMVLADGDDSTTWAAQTALALAEGFYAILTGPAGEYTAPATVASNKASAAIDSYAAKVLVGDWIWFLDNNNGGVQRMISPQGWEAGRLATLGPEQSSLNKPIQGLIGTQSAAAGHVYSTAELTIFGQAGLDLITSPAPGGAYYAARFGQNSSSSRSVNGDNYSRMIPYLTALVGGLGGQFVGRVNTPDEQNEALAAFDAALFGQWRQGRISNPQGTQPYSNRLDNSLATSGVQIMNTRIQLGPIVLDFQVNLQAGQTVQLDRTLSLAA